MAISGPVVLTLLAPKTSVASRFGGTATAPVPEAPVYEYRYLLCGVRKIRSSKQRQMPTPTAEIVFPEDLSDSKLGRLVPAAADARHAARVLGGGWNSVPSAGRWDLHSINGVVMSSRAPLFDFGNAPTFFSRQRIPQHARQDWTHRVRHLKTLAGCSAEEMESIREALQPGTLARTESPVLEGMDAARTGRFAHVLRHGHRG